MNERIIQKFYNLLEVAYQYKNYTDYYFFIKGCAITKAYPILSNDHSGANEKNLQDFENVSKEFQIEKKEVSYKVLYQQQYIDFLENFFSNINFDDADLQTIQKCQDLTELLGCFVEYFDQKIKQLSPVNVSNPVSFQSKQSTFNFQVADNQNNQNNQNNQINQLKQPNMLISKSVQEMNLPEVKDGYKIDDSLISNINSDYIPRLVDRTIQLPIHKSSPNYARVKSLIKEHIELSGLELDFHKLDLSKDHIEAAIYYLRNVKD